jgi:hypothetical protein
MWDYSFLVGLLSVKIPTLTLLKILFFHFIADFCLQTDKMAINKSTSISWLTVHIATYSSFMMLFCGQKYALVNGLLHWAIDFGTSKWTSYLWKKGDRHNFFVVIGLDQLLHATCLILTAGLI